MSAATDAIDQHIDRFIAGDMPFMTFWSAFMDLYHDSGLSGSELDYYEPVYDVVYMGVAEISDPRTPVWAFFRMTR